MPKQHSSRPLQKALAGLACASFLAFGSPTVLAQDLPVDARVSVPVASADYPDADALLMLDDISFEVRPDKSSVFDEHDAVKVLTPDGVDENATLDRILDEDQSKIEVLVARTIKADGRVINAPAPQVTPLVQDSPLYKNVKRFSLRFPEVEVGDTVEFRLRTSHKPKRGGHFWATTYVENPMPIVDSSFTVKVPKGVYFQAAAPGLGADQGTKDEVTEGGVDFQRLRWKIQNQKAFTYRALAPATLSLLNRIEVSSFKSWDEVGRYIGEDWQAHSTISEGLALRVAGWLPNSADIEARASSILRQLGAGRKAASFLSEEQGFHTPSQVFSQKLISLNDASLLTSVALTSAGIENIPVATLGVSAQSLKDELPQPEKVQKIVLQVPTSNGESFWIDPESVGFLLTELPAGTSDTAALSWDHRFSGGAVGAVDLETASAVANREELAVEGRLERNGRAELTLQFDRYGGTALNARQAARDIQEGAREVRDRALDSFFNNAAGAYGQRARLLGRYFESDPEAQDPFSLAFTVAVPSFGKVEGSTLTVPLPRFLSANIRAAVMEKRRETPLRFDQPYQQDVRIHLIFPEGSTVVDAPLKIAKSTPETEFVATGRASGNEVWYVGRLTVMDPWIDGEGLTRALDVLGAAIESEDTEISVSLPAEYHAEEPEVGPEDDEG